MHFSSDSNCSTSISARQHHCRLSKRKYSSYATASIAGTEKEVSAQETVQERNVCKATWELGGNVAGDTIPTRRHDQTNNAQPDLSRLSERAARAKFQPILDAVNAANHSKHYRHTGPPGHQFAESSWTPFSANKLREKELRRCSFRWYLPLGPASCFRIGVRYDADEPLASINKKTVGAPTNDHSYQEFNAWAVCARNRSSSIAKRCC
jgi:hypothetical protein